MSISYNVPNFMNFELKYLHTKESNETIVKFVKTAQRLDEDFIRDYINWATMIVTAVIPVLLLLFFNGSIIWKLYKTTKRMGK